jgi:hypothetical protein
MSKSVNLVSPSSSTLSFSEWGSLSIEQRRQKEERIERRKE